ncbi:MAG TPA: hypothetical protein VK983_00130 [Candidatus Limnocylindrales bacterium]|nr:hypothetical protein [Candidatus Limnocylindrales bacterium]
MLGNLFQASKQKVEQRRAEIKRALIHHEAKIGGELFGPVPPNHRREFFCLDEHTWVWHEEWLDEVGNTRIMMTRYDVRPTGVVKSQGGQSYKSLTRDELRNFYRAAKIYIEKAQADYQHMLQSV